MVAGDSSRCPSVSPPSESADMIRPTERALPCPFSAPMSAFRQPGVFAAFASGAGPRRVRLATLSSGSASRSNGNGGGGTTSAIRPQSASFAPIWKSAPTGPAISAATKSFRCCPVIRRITSPIRWPWLLAW